MSKRQDARHIRDTSIGELLFRIFHFVAKPDGLHDVRAVKEVQPAISPPYLPHISPYLPTVKEVQPAISPPYLPHISPYLPTVKEVQPASAEM